MAVNKSETLNMRVKPQTKQALRLIADREKRSMANALECIVDDYIARNQLDAQRRPTERALQQKHVQGGIS